MVRHFETRALNGLALSCTGLARPSITNPGESRISLLARSPEIARATLQ